MTEVEIRAVLEDGGMVCVGRWNFTAKIMRCDDGCCTDSFESIDEAFEGVLSYSDGMLDSVEEN